jgi:hypothetical protein
MSHEMGWDIQKMFSSHGTGRIPADLRPMGPMEWDGMGPSRPTRSPVLHVYYISKYILF